MHIKKTPLGWTDAQCSICGFIEANSFHGMTPWGTDRKIKDPKRFGIHSFEPHIKHRYKLVYTVRPKIGKQIHAVYYFECATCGYEMQITNGKFWSMRKPMPWPNFSKAFAGFDAAFRDLEAKFDEAEAQLFEDRS